MEVQWQGGSSVGQRSGTAHPPQLTGAPYLRHVLAKGLPLGMVVLSILLYSPKRAVKSEKKACLPLPESSSTFTCLISGKDLALFHFHYV